MRGRKFCKNDQLATSAEDFVNRILLDRLGMTDLVVGYDYAMGRNRVGNAAFLEAQGAARGFSVEVVPAFYMQGRLVSSTVIRTLVAEGKMRDLISCWLIRKCAAPRQMPPPPKDCSANYEIGRASCRERV